MCKQTKKVIVVITRKDMVVLNQFSPLGTCANAICVLSIHWITGGMYNYIKKIRGKKQFNEIKGFLC